MRIEGQAGQIFPKTTYILEALADGRTPDGTLLEIRLYLTEKGTKVSTAHGHFMTAQAAKNELRRLVQEATYVRERRPKIGRFGGIVGERAVIMSATSGTRESDAQVVWTSGNDLYEIISPSLPLVLDMERRYYP